MEAIYTAEALSTGAGRDGHVSTPDGRLDLDMAVPTEMGGSGNGANPELLFAAGFAACFHSALQGVARQAGVDVQGSTVGGRVDIGKREDGGFGLAVTLEVVLPDVPHEQAQQLADKAHEVCPYSHATRGNIDVTVTVSDD
ncbi:organic hydroperoxide resistance protein [Oceanitalea stevensii]|uniref:Organic hydroperoxide resistance protein n=1 Tax=Oceanitalea stevensii TaxID=2763072 RepID=A0ABR8YZG4_9MICO|nr:organic hydroperoxide resistance protein [Oceanitalea stevensii]MBD8061459.1 organic hydroperoxide resistance protein [Oceanitalea stevensii]